MGNANKRSTKRHASRTSMQSSKQSANNLPGQSSSVRINHSEVPKSSVIPFHSTDRILLVGEGDFSFSKALLTSYKCTSVLTTSYDSRSAVFTKYPQAVSNIEALEAEQQTVIFEVDATKIGSSRAGSGGKLIKKAKFDKIVFNFPHVGGKTKDVARQIRHNQELLLGFFKAAVQLLAPMGLIIVTLFEGQPYDAWDLKGLAKNAQLKSQRSFKFDSHLYPNYKHARTLGNIVGGRGWKGEERPARTYLLELSDGIGPKARIEGITQEDSAKRNMQAVTDEITSSAKKRKRVEVDSDSD